MIKVINIITDTNIGGAGHCLLVFLDGYDKKKFSMEVFIPHDSQLKSELIKRGVSFTEVDYINDRSLNIKAVRTLYALFKQKKPDIVHTHAAMSARIAAKLYGKCKIIHTRHSVFPQPSYKKTFPVKQLHGGINNFLSDRIISVSPAATDNLTETGTSPKKISLIYNGVFTVKRISAEAKAELRKHYGLAQTDYVVAIIARLVNVKGHDYLLDAAKCCVQEQPGIKFLIIGTGPEEARLKARVAAEKIDNVIFTGFIKNTGAIENIINLQVNASYGTEATSLSLLEGMSLGIPAVVSDFGGNPYVIKSGVNGLVVPQQNSKELYEAIYRLKQDKRLYDELSKNAVSEFEKNFKAQVMSRKICELYSGLNHKKETKA